MENSANLKQRVHIHQLTTINLTHAHSHITRALAAMDSCFVLTGAHLPRALTKLFYCIKNLKFPLYTANCVEKLKLVFLSEVAHKSFCVKFSGLISKLKILEKSYQSPRIFNVQTYVWSLFKAKKIMVHQ